MDIKESIQSILEKFGVSGDVKKLYGDPIEKNGKTVIPVASVSYGFGGGYGNKNKENANGEEGAGLGGGISAKPIGVIEITDEGTRFIRFNQTPVLIGIAAVSIAIGSIVKHLAKRR